LVIEQGRLKNLLQPIVSGISLLKGEFDEVLNALPEAEVNRVKTSRGMSEEASQMVKNTTLCGRK